MLRRYALCCWKGELCSYWFSCLNYFSVVCFSLYVYECFAGLYVWVPSVLNTQRCQKRVLDPLGLEFQVSCQMGAENWAWNSAGRAASVLMAELSLQPVLVFITHFMGYLKKKFLLPQPQNFWDYRYEPTPYLALGNPFRRHKLLFITSTQRTDFLLSLSISLCIFGCEVTLYTNFLICVH